MPTLSQVGVIKSLVHRWAQEHQHSNEASPQENNNTNNNGQQLPQQDVNATAVTTSTTTTPRQDSLSNSNNQVAESAAVGGHHPLHVAGIRPDQVLNAASSTSQTGDICSISLI